MSGELMEPYDSGPLEDEETAHASDQLFAWSDAEEELEGHYCSRG